MLKLYLVTLGLVLITQFSIAEEQASTFCKIVISIETPTNSNYTYGPEPIEYWFRDFGEYSEISLADAKKLFLLLSENESNSDKIVKIADSVLEELSDIDVGRQLSGPNDHLFSEIEHDGIYNFQVGYEKKFFRHFKKKRIKSKRINKKVCTGWKIKGDDYEWHLYEDKDTGYPVFIEFKSDEYHLKINYLTYDCGIPFEKSPFMSLPIDLINDTTK